MFTIYLEMKQTKEKVIEYLTLHIKKKEGIITTIVIINTVCVTDLYIIIIYECFVLRYWERATVGVCKEREWAGDTAGNHNVINLTIKREKQTDWTAKAELDRLLVLVISHFMSLLLDLAFISKACKLVTYQELKKAQTQPNQEQSMQFISETAGNTIRECVVCHIILWKSYVY